MPTAAAAEGSLSNSCSSLQILLMSRSISFSVLSGEPGPILVEEAAAAAVGPLLCLSLAGFRTCCLCPPPPPLLPLLLLSSEELLFPAAIVGGDSSSFCIDLCTSLLLSAPASSSSSTNRTVCCCLLLLLDSCWCFAVSAFSLLCLCWCMERLVVVVVLVVRAGEDSREEVVDEVVVVVVLLRLSTRSLSLSLESSLLGLPLLLSSPTFFSSPSMLILTNFSLGAPVSGSNPAPLPGLFLKADHSGSSIPSREEKVGTKSSPLANRMGTTLSFIGGGEAAPILSGAGGGGEEGGGSENCWWQ